jgi:hypothetical protein
MNVRNVLQNAIWGKRALGRILIGFGVVVTVLVVGSGIFYEVNWHWLTSGERSAASAALTEIDLLQNAQSMNSEDFDSQEERAKLKLGTARDLIRTYRDKEMVAVLSYYFILTTAPWDQARFNLEYPGFSSSDADLKSEVRRWTSEVKVRKQVSSTLHKELD